MIFLMISFTVLNIENDSFLKMSQEVPTFVFKKRKKLGGKHKRKPNQRNLIFHKRKNNF